MGLTKRMISAGAVLLIVAAGCSDDPAPDAATVDSVLDEIVEPTEPTEPTEPPGTTAPTVTPAPEPSEPEPEPMTPVVVDNCVILRHYQATGLFEAPYYTTVTTLIDLTGEEEVTVVMPDGNEYDLGVWPSDADGPGQIDVNFPVFAPGDVVLPEIYVDGVPIHLDLIESFWDGNDGFVAASAEVRDEEIYPTPACTMGYFVQADPGTLGFG